MLDRDDNMKRRSAPNGHRQQTDLFHDDQEPTDTETSSFLQQQERLSFASRAVDFGTKGYLTSAERTMRSYDQDGTGKYSKKDFLRVVLDLDKERSRKKGYRRILRIVGIAFLVLLVAIFGLIYSTVTLMRQVISTNSASELVDARTGQVLRTRTERVVIPVTVNPSGGGGDDGRRHLGRIYQGALRESLFAEALANNLVDSLTFSLTILAGANDDDATTSGSETYTLQWNSLSTSTFENGAYRVRGADTNGVSYVVNCEPEPANASANRWCYLSETHPYPSVVTAVSQTTATIWYRFDTETNDGTVKVSIDGIGDFTDSSFSDSTDYCGSVSVTGLSPGQRYTYKVYFDQVLIDFGFTANDDDATDTSFAFRTLQPAGDGEDFSFVIFSDASKYFADQKAQTYKTAGDYQAIPDQEHSFAFQIGDFDHSDPLTLSAMRTMNRELRSPHRFHGRSLIRNILSKMPFFHIWDDHDYCGNDSDGTCAVKSESFQAYGEYYPGFDRHPDGTEGNWYSFEAGHAEFFVLDTRSQRSPIIDPDPASYSAKTMLGGVQLAWLLNSLQTSTRKWKIIISTVTANIVARRTNLDHWTTGFKTETNIIKEAIANAGIRDNILMISGDLHTGGGVDDGCNNGFNVAELSVPHTNLGKGNSDRLGDWTQGVSTGDVGGFGVVTVTADSLTVKSVPLDLDSSRIHTLTMPTSASTGCTEARAYEHNFEICSQNYHDFNAPNENPDDKCLDIPKDEEVTYPFTASDGTTLTSEVQFYKCETSQRRVIIANNVPHHTILRGNMHQLCERQWFASLPLNPEVIPIEMGKFEPGHHIGFAWDGIVTYGPLELSSENAIELNPGADILDAQYWYGHTGQKGIWHYHNPSMGVEQTLSKTDLLGYAMDGFPIYGPLNAPNLKLDECNFDEENKRYHIRTVDQVDESLPYCNPDNPEALNWKYVIGCYRGNPRLSFVKNAKDEDVELPDDCVLEDHSAEFADYYSRLRRLNQLKTKRKENRREK